MESPLGWVESNQPWVAEDEMLDLDMFRCILNFIFS